MKKLLVIGASGLLGSKIVECGRIRYDVVGTCNPECDGRSNWRLEPLDMGSKDEVERLFQKVRPESVILTAAMTNVDACEKQPVMATRVNATGPELVARSCKSIGARLVHVSTDYVFDGSKSRKYKEDDLPRPISTYGVSKLAGERAVMSTLPEAAVARTAVLYGWGPLEDKGNFVTWVLRKLRAGEKVTLFQDQQVSPTFADDLADALLALADKDLKGIWHVAGPDCLNRFECGEVIAKVFDQDGKLIVPVTSSSISLPAKRPKNSCLDSSKIEKLLNRKMKSFETGLKRMSEQEAGRR